jgi:hypothetical protein
MFCAAIELVEDVPIDRASGDERRESRLEYASSTLAFGSYFFVPRRCFGAANHFAF